MNVEDAIFENGNSIAENISVLLFLEDTLNDDENASKRLLKYFKEAIKTKMTMERYRKMFYLRKTFLGLCYWSNNNPLTENEYVR